MDEEGFRRSLKKQRRSDGTIQTCIDFTLKFEQYLEKHRKEKTVENVKIADLEAFIEWGKSEIGSMNSYLWALGRYFEFSEQESLRKRANQMRQSEIAKKRGKGKKLLLRKIHGVQEEDVKKLESEGVSDTKTMLISGRTHELRVELSKRIGVPLKRIVEFVKIADLTRIVDIKGVRVRLLYSTGVDTVEKVAIQDPETLRELTIKVNEAEKLMKRHPTLVETTYWIRQAKELEPIIDWNN
ncbi:MAG: hypothetical protein ThorAB25_13380 [Candidatus Thorarchaeota archaeon AB_25]|nr:MAG: hypothetical protein ThorAB25_13380 [Candidatus Thorarchaeota archaeon AB_25]